MSLITEKEVLLLFGGLLLAGILEFPCILVMHFLMPRTVMDRYWKMPHFKPMELALFNNTIYAPMCTIMLMGVIAFPRWGKKEKPVRSAPTGSEMVSDRLDCALHMDSYRHRRHPGNHHRLKHARVPQWRTHLVADAGWRGV